MKRMVFASPEQMREKKKAFEKTLCCAGFNDVLEFFMLVAGKGERSIPAAMQEQMNTIQEYHAGWMPQNKKFELT